MKMVLHIFWHVPIVIGVLWRLGYNLRRARGSQDSWRRLQMGESLCLRRKRGTRIVSERRKWRQGGRMGVKCCPRPRTLLRQISNRTMRRRRVTTTCSQTSPLSTNPRSRLRPPPIHSLRTTSASPRRRRIHAS